MHGWKTVELKKVTAMKIFRIVFVLAALLITLSNPGSAADYGTIFSLAYNPCGYAALNAPMGSGTGTDNAEPQMKNVVESSDAIVISAAGYYNSFQCSAEYSYISGERLLSPYTSTSLQDQFTGRADSEKVRCGLRFSRPGDTSYEFIYAGAQRLGFSTALQDSSCTSYGPLVGASFFNSVGVFSATEFVTVADIYLGTYPLYNIASVRSFTGYQKIYSVSAGGTIGAGIQYEPYNISFLIQVRTSFDYISCHGNENGMMNTFRIGMESSTVGLAIIYAIPAVSYNKVE
jgi:hypothetical protein